MPSESACEVLMPKKRLYKISQEVSGYFYYYSITKLY
jgi:hypothetical protein